MTFFKNEGQDQNKSLIKQGGWVEIIMTQLYPVADLRRRPKGAMAPLRDETAINKAPKLLL